MAPTDDLLGSLDQTVGDDLVEVGEKLTDAAPMLRQVGSQKQVRPPTERISVGLVTRRGAPTPAVFVEKSSPWSRRKAEEIQDAIGTRVPIIVIGKAYSSWPKDPVPQGDTGNGSFLGSSVSHYGGYAGTLGCFVQARVRKRARLGFLGSSHVLGMINSAETDDAILLPGYPDGPKTRENQIGSLTNFTYLVHHQEEEPGGRSLNTDDVAFVAFLSQDDCPQVNLVPKPTKPTEKKRLKGVAELDEVPKYFNKKVYKRGRTTGLTRGTFLGQLTEPRSVRLPDGKIYLYEQTLIVRTIGTKSFSQPGDSGSLVYTSDYKGLGLVIGGSNEYSFLAPLATCLAAMKAELLT